MLSISSTRLEYLPTSSNGLCDQSPQNKLQAEAPAVDASVHEAEDVAAAPATPAAEGEAPAFSFEFNPAPEANAMLPSGSDLEATGGVPDKTGAPVAPSTDGSADINLGAPGMRNVGLCFSCSGKPCVNPVNATESPRASAK